MAETNNTPTEAQQKAAAFLTRPKPSFEAWRDARKADDIKAAEARAVALSKAIENASIGDILPDGSVYVGISPDTNKPMCATAADAPVSMSFNAAAQYAEELDAHGHSDWRVPTIEELNVLYQNHEKGALKGTFNISGSPNLNAHHWSSTPCFKDDGWYLEFSQGYRNTYTKSLDTYVRCVRS